MGTPTGETSSKIVGMPNGQPIRAKRKMRLPLPQLAEKARMSDELPQLHSNLVSVPTLANNGYISIFRPHNEELEVPKSQDVKIKATSKPVLRGWRDCSGLWRITLETGTGTEWQDFCVHQIQLPAHQINNLYHLPSVEARVAYIHACLGFPTKAAMLSAATAGFLVGIPFATVANIRRFYPETIETPKGHMDQQRQGVRLTKEKAVEKELEGENAAKERSK